jgi:hypothetical protein
MSENAKKIFVSFIIISSVSFFELVIFNRNIINYIQILSIGFIIAFLLINIFYNSSRTFKQNFRTEIILLFAAVIISMFGAYYYHNQSFKYTVIAQKELYFFLFYFALHKLKIKPNHIIHIVIYISLFYSILYLLQTIIFPAQILSSQMFYNRGTLRIYMPGSGFLIISFFYALHQVIAYNRIKFIFLCIFFFIIFILQGSRQVLASVFLVSILYVFYNKKDKLSKFLMVVLVILSIIPLLHIFKNIFVSIISVTKIQPSFIEENIRFKAAIFFLLEFFPNKITYIIGNGMPSSHSIYGLKINAYKEMFGFYQSDIGIIGEYTKFGLLFIIAELSILIRSLYKKIKDNFIFVKYVIILIMLTLFTGAGAFGVDSNIIIICLLLYIIDINKINDSAKTNETEKISINTTDIQ